METPVYNWECQVCGAPNLAGVGLCAKCNFPAVANGRAIAAAKRAILPEASNSTQQSPGFFQSVSTFLSAPLPVWRKVVGVAGFAGFVGGMLLFRLAVSFFQFALGAFVVVISLLAMKAVLGSGRARAGG